MTAYYNEIDPYAAQWLRNLIVAGYIASGDVDERSISDVQPDDLKGYTQCHFFAGIGVWSLALRRAGWDDDTPVWTGSCPCQPFSTAGRGAGFIDERHLWPHWFHLITQCEPDRIFGEQVGSKDGLGWLDLVQTDLEGAGYANGAVDICAAGVGSPNIRQRLYIAAERMADSDNSRLEGWIGVSERTDQLAVGANRVVGGLAHPPSAGRKERSQNTAGGGKRSAPERMEQRVGGDGILNGRLADAGSAGPEAKMQQHRNGTQAEVFGQANGGGGDRLPSRLGHTDSQHPGRDAGAGVEAQGEDGSGAISNSAGASSPDHRPGPTNGLWRDADWLSCRDGKWRPVESGTFPLANGAPQRVGRLRAYGNAINVEVAQTFIEAYMSCS